MKKHHQKKLMNKKMMLMRSIKVLTMTCLISSIVGCVTLQSRARPSASEVERIPSYAISTNEKTRLGDSLADAIQHNSQKSGFRIFEKGSESLMARLALIRLADKSLDLQYYGLANDTCSRLMMEALIRAAERGVRVRLLLDNYTIADMEESLLALENVPKIEIRVFNPTTTKDQALFSKVQGLFTDLPYANKRMHNKAFIADNKIVILGGRNVSDEYFEADADLDFKDVDVLAAGPIAADVSKSFDLYWNDKNSFPVQAVHEQEHSPEEVKKLRAMMKENWEKELLNPKRKMQLAASIEEVMGDSGMSMIWASAELAVDDPSKIEEPRNSQASEPLNSLVDLLNKAHEEFIVVSAYFVPLKEGVEWLKGLKEKGLDIKILTNSLASTDVVAVHSGYAPWRKPLLENGIELYELMPIKGEKSSQRLAGRSQPPRAGLHSKLYIIDGEHTLVGSFNLDPRSVELNTEIALVIHSKEIAQKMKRLFERATAEDVSYRLGLDKDNSLVWNGIEKTKKVHHRREPHAGVMRTLQSGISNIIPDSQL